MGDSIIRRQEADWSNFSNFLTNTFKSQFGDQSAIFKTLTAQLTSQLTNPHGFDPATLSALRGGATDNLTRQFQNARQAIGSTFAQNGSLGGDVKSGVNSQIMGALSGQQAQSQAGALNDIEMKNAELKQNNFWKALGGLQGVAEAENPAVYAHLANNAADTTGKLGSEYFGTDQSGFWDRLGGSFAESLGSGLGSTLSGGAGAKKKLGS